MFNKKVGMALLLSLALVACDGDGYGSDDNDGDTGGGDTGGDTGGGGTGGDSDDGPVTLDVGSGVGGSFESGQLNIDDDSLSAGGETQISLNVVNTSDNDSLYVGQTVNVSFSSQCASLSTPTALFSPAETSGQGTLSTTYSAQGCLSDVITATVTIDGETEVATGSITIAPIDVGVIEGQQPSPSTIALKGYGTDTVPSTTKVTFIVKNKQGDPVSGQEVSFSIPYNLAGIELTKVDGITNSDGSVTAVAQGGTINSVFVVRAETDVLDTDGSVLETIFTDSKPISVNSGRPNAAGFGMAIEENNFNPWSWNVFNVPVGFTVKASEYHNGPVPDGTVVSFVASGGQIQLSGSDIASCEMAAGDCSVVWESGPPFPVNGVAVVMAHTIGEEAFEDENGNSAYDIGEDFEALPEPFLDANQNGVYDADSTPREYFVDLNGNGSWDDIEPVPADRRYRGASCSDAARAQGHCAQMAYLFDTSRVVLSSAEVEFIPAVVPTVDVSNGSQTVSIEVTDVNGNIPPSGTSASVSCDGDVVSGTLKPQDSIPNLSLIGAGWTWSFTLESPDDPPDGDGADGEEDTCYLDVDRADGLVESLEIPVVY